MWCLTTEDKKESKARHASLLRVTRRSRPPKTHRRGACYLQKDLKRKSASEDIICIT